MHLPVDSLMISEHDKMDTELIKCVQRRAAKLVKRQENWIYDEGLKRKKKLRGDLIIFYCFLARAS